MRRFLGGWMVVLALAAPAAPAAFHGEAGNCASCHVVHNSVDGRPVVPGGGYDDQLLADNPSDVCLMCHAREAGAVLGTNPLAPPPEKGSGNFVYLLEDNLNDGPDGRLDPIPGAAAGHNVVAPGHGLAPETRHAQAPGGTFLSTDLGCTSCHDPHERATFRMLYGAGPIQGGLAAFTAPAPDAEGIDLGAGGELPTNHSAYREGMSLWCGNCHGAYHREGVSGFQHPVDDMLDLATRDQYNEYNGEDDPTGGTQALAYLPEVAFEELSQATSSRMGPTAAARLSCLSCHRAHASSAPASLRWDPNVDLLADDGVVSGSWPIPDPYASPSQGTLCRKCHEVIPTATPDPFAPPTPGRE